MRKSKDSFWALGLMSGTSLDGIDAALLQTDGERILALGPWLTIPYDNDFKQTLRAAVKGKGDMLIAEREVTLRHADAVKKLLEHAGMKRDAIDVIGFHGQTVSHRPQHGITWQIGDGNLLAEKTGIDVVCDFRRRDVAAGGEGAPLVPLYHAALARQLELPVAVLNIGGIANVTWVGRSEEMAGSLLELDIMAFDTGPGNAMLNDWALRHRGVDCDLNGALAAAGTPDASVLQHLLSDAFFAKTPPKSLDRNHFPLTPLETLTPEDGAATLVEFMAAAVEQGGRYFPRPASQWFVTGGGRHNPTMMQALKRRLGKVFTVEALGWAGDALEAQAFAFLAVRSLKGLPLSLPTTTGAIRPVTGGAYYQA